MRSVCPSRTLDELVPSSRQKRRAPYIVATVLGGIVVVAAVVGFWPYGGPSSGTTLGPYTLGLGSTYYNDSVNLSFPLCSVVKVAWNVTGTGNATLAVWGPPVPPGEYSCPSAAPYENLTCPNQGCPSIVSGETLMCIEAGARGACEFQSGPTNYTFLNYVPYDTGPFTALSFTASFS